MLPVVGSLCGLALCAASCADGGSAIRIKLVVDPQLNSEAQVLAVVDQIQLVLDAPGGLPRGTGELTPRDVDVDGEPELVFSEGVSGRTSFPLYRLRAGSMGDQPFTVAARGTVGGQLAAMGAAVTARFAQQADLEVSVPLDLRAKYRPPRVVATLPQDGQQQVPPALGAVHVVFSKWIDPASLAGNLVLSYRGPAGDSPVPGSWGLVNTSASEGGLPEERALATADLGSCNLSAGTYVIEARAGITDVGGVGLDQRPDTDAAEAFNATFSLPGTPGDGPCGAGPAVGCTQDSECDASTPPRFVCAREGAAGRCVPAPVSCDSVIGCPDGYGCVDDGGKVACVREQSPTCATANPCPEGFRCEGGGQDPFICIQQPVVVGGCAADGAEPCAVTTHCNEQTGKCVPCEVYPSPGCEIECTEATAAKCPDGTVCNLEQKTCRS